MKLYPLLFFTILTSIAGCQNKLTEKPKDYKLVEDEGIFVEQFDSTDVDENRYTANNLTFKEGTQFIYSYEHITADKEILFFEEDKSIDDWKYSWRFVSSDSTNENTIKKVKVTVKSGLQPMIQHVPDYNQTIIQFDYPAESGNSSFNSASGVIENESNIWMHPPRDKYFRILELNPFPFIKAPYKIGNEWNWSLKIGSAWGDSRWKTWEGTIENLYNYKITDKLNIDTKFGKIECFEIQSKAASEIGETKLTAFFNAKYGFVKLNYVNIDGSLTNLELVEYVENKNSK